VNPAWRKLLLLAVAVAVVAAVLWPRPRLSRTGADLLPADTPFFFSIPDIARAGESWAGAQHGPVSATLQNGSLAEAARSLVPRRWGKLIALAARGAVQVAEGEVFVAVTGFQTAPAIVPQIVAGCRLGSRRERLPECVADLQRWVRQEFPSAAGSPRQYLRSEYHQWDLQPGLQLCAADLGDWWLTTLGELPMMEVIERLRNPARRRLSDSGTFVDLRARWPGHPDALLAVQADALAAKFGPMLQWLPQLQDLAEPFAGVMGVGWSLTPEPGRARDSLVVVRRGRNAPTNRPMSFTLPDRLPASSVALVAAQIEPRALYRLFMRGTVGLGHRDWAKSLALFEVGWSDAGVDFSSDVLSALAPLCAFVADWPSADGAPALLFGAPVREQGRIEAAMRRAARGAHGAPLMWRMTGGWLWLSPSAGALERVARTAAGEQATLRSACRRSEALGSLPPKGWLWAYADWSRLVCAGDGAAPQQLFANVTNRGRYEVGTAVSPLGLGATAWFAAEKLIAGRAERR
jgi:hypothetical protein